jgi:hypothetical protein
MTRPIYKQQDEFAKPTFRAVNQSYLLFGLIDWRYATVCLLPAMFLGAIAHSRTFGCVAAIVFQVAAFLVYRKDAAAPLVWIYGLMDRKHLCPFKQ